MKLIVQNICQYNISLSCKELDYKIDTTLMSVNIYDAITQAAS